jgi:hypothetical protein
MLSYTFLRSTNKEDIIVPMVGLISPLLYCLHHLYVGGIFYCFNSGFFCQHFNFELDDFVLSNMNSLLGDWDTAKFGFSQNDIMSKPMWMDYSCISY